MADDEGKTLVEEIDDMLEGYSSEEHEEAEDEEKEIEEGEEVTDELEEEEEAVEEEPKQEETVAEGEEESEEEEDLGEETEEVEEEGTEEVDELTTLRNQINAQAELLLKHGIGFPTEGEVEETPAKVEIPAGQETEMAQAPDGSFEILGENESLDDILNDRESFVNWASGFAQRVIQSGTQGYLRSLPGVVAPQVRQVMDLQRAVDAFYTENEDLVPVRPTVGALSQQVVKEHPDWTLNQVFEESGKRARKMLRLPDPGKAKREKGKRKPSFAKPKGKGRKPKPKISKLQKEIDELL